MQAYRRHQALIALLLGWCLFVNIFTCCLEQPYAKQSGSVSVAYCSLHGRADLNISLVDRTAPVEADADLAALLGCPLCASSGTVASLTANWRLPQLPIVQPFRANYPAPFTVHPEFRNTLRARAPPFIS